MKNTVRPLAVRCINNIVRLLRLDIWITRGPSGGEMSKNIKNIRNIFTENITHKIPISTKLTDSKTNKKTIILGEGPIAALADKYVSEFESLRESEMQRLTPEYL